MLHMKEKNVLFITTKNLDYLRNVQEIDMLCDTAVSVDVVGYKDKSYIKRLIKIYTKLLFSSLRKYDSIFIGFAPQLILPLFKWKMKNKEIVIDFFISVYDTLVFDRRKFKEKSICGRLCKWLDTKCIHAANSVIADTKAHADYFSNEFEVERSKINVLYLKADDSIYYKRECVKAEKIKDKFVVLYFGSILPLQGVEVVLEAIDILADQKDVYFYVIGPTGKFDNIPIHDNVEYIEWLPQETLAEYIAQADLCLAGHFNAEINKAKRTIPGKAYIYEAMDKPMILGDNQATRELYSDDNKHFFVTMGNAKELADKILSVKQMI